VGENPPEEATIYELIKQFYEELKEVKKRVEGLSIPSEEDIEKAVEKVYEEKFKPIEITEPMIDLETGEQYRPPAYGPPAYAPPPKYPKMLYPIPKLIALIEKLAKGKLDMTLRDFIAMLRGEKVAKEGEEAVSTVLPSTEAREVDLDKATPEQISKLVEAWYPERFPKR